MRTWKILRQLTYNKGNQTVIEWWENSRRPRTFSIRVYIGAEKRILLRTKFILALTDMDKTFGRKNPRFRTYE